MTRSAMQPLPHSHRRLYFRGLLLVFVIAMPLLFLYATGYRFHNGTELVSTGGIYIGTDSSGSEIYIDNELVRETRTFRRGFYAQNLEPGTHRVHVQRDDHHAWVKELTVVPHRVTEAQAFTMPLDPTIREIPRYQLSDGTLLFEHGTSTATTTRAILADDTITKEENVEHTLISELFATGTPSSEHLAAAPQESLFDLGTTDTAATSALATTTKIFRDVKIFERGDDLFATWVGPSEDIPYYFCVFSEERASSTDAATASSTTEMTRECREEIRMEDFYGREIRGFDFYPDNSDLIVLALEDGIYVEEIDDRGWQNIQPLYLKVDLEMRVRDGHIYVKDGPAFFEIMIDDT